MPRSVPARGFVDVLHCTTRVSTPCGANSSTENGRANEPPPAHYGPTSISSAPAPGWLGPLETALRLPGAGIVGATGSWASHWSWLRFNKGLSTPYREAFDDRGWAHRQVMRLTPDRRRVLTPVWARHLIGSIR